MRRLALAAAVLVATAAFVRGRVAWSHSDGPDRTGARAATLDARGAERVTVESGAGDLRVVGVEGGSGQLRVQGTAHASRSGVLKAIKLEVRREGDRLFVRAVLPAHSPRRWFGGRNSASQSLDMIVEVPASLEADVTAGSGEVEVRGVSALRITDGAGDLHVEDVRGPVRVTDASGDVTLRDVGGDVWLEDGSGEVTAERIAGSVVFAEDGSGGLSAEQVEGDVLVRNDGSGDIAVSNVGGRFIVTRDGSGEVSYADVRGAVEVPRRKRER